jgi:hypothetical protein
MNAQRALRDFLAARPVNVAVARSQIRDREPHSAGQFC